MAELRGILLILGLLILAGVYCYSRGWLGRGVALASKLQHRREPTLVDGGDSVSPPEEPQPEPVLRSDPQADLTQVTLAPDEKSKIVTIRMLPQPGQLLAGKQLAPALHSAGLEFGKFSIYHRIDPQSPSHPLFSVANLVEPGSFDVDHVAESEYSGVSFFMVLPGPDDMLIAFDEMLSAARSLAESLGANLCDERGSTLSVQRTRYMREELVQFQHQTSRADALCG